MRRLHSTQARPARPWAHSPLILLAWLLWPIPAGALDYGFSGGSGLPLRPTASPGATLAASAIATSRDGLPGTLLRARGEILGLLSPDAQAALPTLTGDVGGRLGPVDLFFTGGVELFGFAWRDGAALFSTLGLLGGVGLSWQLTEHTRLSFRGLLLWLPNDTTAILDLPEGVEKPENLWVMGLLGLELWGGPQSGRWE